MGWGNQTTGHHEGTDTGKHELYSSNPEEQKRRRKALAEAAKIKQEQSCNCSYCRSKRGEV